jgi:hypothetical protein
MHTIKDGDVVLFGVVHGTNQVGSFSKYSRSPCICQVHEQILVRELVVHMRWGHLVGPRVDQVSIDSVQAVHRDLIVLKDLFDSRIDPLEMIGCRCRKQGARDILPLRTC